MAHILKKRVKTRWLARSINVSRRGDGLAKPIGVSRRWLARPICDNDTTLAYKTERDQVFGLKKEIT